MSSVRMCDKCGQIFSENEEDWSTYSGSRKRRREDGSRYTETIVQDACPPCTNGDTVIKPRLGIVDYRKIAAMESELGIGQDKPGGAGG